MHLVTLDEIFVKAGHTHFSIRILTMQDYVTLRTSLTLVSQSVSQSVSQWV